MISRKNDYHEIVNIFFKVRNPRIIFFLFRNIISTLGRRFFGRLRSFHIDNYPPKVLEIYKKIPKKIKNNIHFENSISYFDDKKIKLKLAKGFVEFNNQPNWKQTFNDEEQFFSLHRWGWLLHSLSSQEKGVDKDWGGALIRSWLFEMSPLPDGPASESYSTGERISNTCLFFRHINGNWDEVPSDILFALHDMAHDLSRKIEYYSDDLSGNHVINNARAIYFASYCCNDSNLMLLAHSIFEDHLKKLVDVNGFLREGSSHYQFLFTRWILEIRMLADEKKDQIVLSQIDLIIAKLLSACKFLLIGQKNREAFFPLVGDISPDCEPEWLYDVLKSTLAGIPDYKNNKDRLGWARLFDKYEAKNPTNLDLFSNLSKGWNSFSKSGWHRLEFGAWTAIFHAEASMGSAIASHAHYDFGSVVLFYHGKEILIDSGRYDYTESPLGRYGVNASAHNTILLNGFSPMLTRGDRLMPELYREAESSVFFEKFENSIKIKFVHEGFSRISKKSITHTREYIFSNKSCEISDQLLGSGNYFFECFFHYPVLSDISKDLDNDKRTLDKIYSQLGIKMTPNKNNKIKIDLNMSSNNPIRGIRSLSYGKISSALTQRFYGHIELPFNLTHKLSQE